MKWTALVALAFISLVAGDGAWKENYEYKYKVMSRNLNATTSDNWNGVIFRAHLSIFAQSTDLLIGKIIDAEYAEVELPRRWDLELEDRKLNFQQWSLRQPFQINLRNGVIYSLSVDSSVTNAQIKQLKVIINQLQVNTRDRSERNNHNVLYTIKEQSLFGSCETSYDISPIAEYLTKSSPEWVPLPELKGDGEFIVITKTRNYSNCDEVMDSSNRNTFGDNSSPLEVGYLVLSGSLKSYIIHSSITTIKIPSEGDSEKENRNPLKSVSFVQLSLESVEENNRRPQFLSRDLVRTGMSVYADTVLSESNESDSSARSEFSAMEPSLAPNAIRFKNAYIQNVQSGSCVTIIKDKNLSPLFASKCNCNSLQLWKTQNGESVSSELATYGYMDLFFGKPGNGETVGNFGLTGSKWQKWTFQEGTDGSYSVINQHTKKCLYEGPNGKITQLDCNGRDTLQKWKVVENPCGEPPKFPIGRFQLQNPQTGKCAVIFNDSNSHFAKVVSTTCSCTNNYHYWILRILTLINQGRTKQCMANWEEQGYSGITQCGCVNDPYHNWGFVYVEVGVFIIVTSIDGRCVQVTGNNDNAPLQYAQCDLTDRTQMWRIYDECNNLPFAGDNSL